MPLEQHWRTAAFEETRPKPRAQPEPPLTADVMPALIPFGRHAPQFNKSISEQQSQQTITSEVAGGVVGLGGKGKRSGGETPNPWRQSGPSPLHPA